MSTMATLKYQVTAVGPTDPLALKSACETVPLPFGDYAPFGVTLNTDVTAIFFGVDILRTITLNLDSTFNTLFPPGTDQAAPFRDLYTHILANALSSMVLVSDPILS